MAKIRRGISAVEAFALYLLTGASCLVVGSSLPQLMEHFNTSLVMVTAVGSAFALGRMLTVLFTGMLITKVGPKIVVGAGFFLLFCFLGGLTVVTTIQGAFVCAALGGVGMGTQDAACPEILTEVFPEHYPSALSTGQAFFGAGCFLPPLVMSIVLANNKPFYLTYLIFAVLCLIMLLLLPFMKLEKRNGVRQDAGPVPENGRGKGSRGMWGLFAVFCVFYCAATNTINLYTSSYAESMGLPASVAVNVLTLYSVGSMVGSLGFAALLKRIKPVNLLCVNLSGALVCLVLALFTRSFAALAGVYFLTGVFLGVLFSIAVTLAVGLSAGQAGKAGAITAMLTGGADFVAPLATGMLVTAFGITANVWFAIASAGISLFSALLFREGQRREMAKKG